MRSRFFQPLDGITVIGPKRPRRNLPLPAKPRQLPGVLHPSGYLLIAPEADLGEIWAEPDIVYEDGSSLDDRVRER
jgi:hypothetical protein